MATTVTAHFDTRRDAELAIERLIQKHGLDRRTISVGAAGAENTVGITAAGADTDAATGVPEEAAQAGRVAVTVAAGAASTRIVRDAFAECGAADITASEAGSARP